MTYDIRSVDELENSTARLSSSNQVVSNDADSLAYILEQIKTNWQNEAGTDLASIILELEKCIQSLKNAINPTVSKYIETMNTLVAESRTTQSRSM